MSRQILGTKKGTISSQNGPGLRRENYVEIDKVCDRSHYAEELIWEISVNRCNCRMKLWSSSSSMELWKVDYYCH